MLRASALYLVIVIALVMAVICSSLIAAAYFYKLQYQKTFRHGQLVNNLGSGINILLESSQDVNGNALSLFGDDNDTVLLKGQPWGVFRVGTVKAFEQQDTISRAFLIGNALDSASWSALYLIDEDRPLSVSGKTIIKGTAYLPKAGIKEAYVGEMSYEGDKRLVIGPKKDSRNTLPLLDQNTLQQLEKYLTQTYRKDSLLLQLDSVSNSFLQSPLSLTLGKKVVAITNRLSGNIMLQSDTALTIENGASLDNVLIFARSITVRKGFHGRCQLYATDSIRIEQGCTFDYPSVLGVMNFQDTETSGVQKKLITGDNTKISGTLFTYEKNKMRLLPLLDIGKGAILSGQLYSSGLLNFKDGVTINGSVMANRFIYQTTYTRYENYLINISINGPALSRYYLSGDLLPAKAKPKKVLQWLQ